MCEKKTLLNKYIHDKANYNMHMLKHFLYHHNVEVVQLIYAVRIKK